MECGVSLVGAAGFLWSLYVFWCISIVVVEGACVRDCRGLRLSKVGIVGWQVGDECVGGKGSLVTGYGKMGREGVGWGKKVGEKGQNKFLGRVAMDVSTGEGRRVKGMRVG
jgi:hypothetical protein